MISGLPNPKKTFHEKNKQFFFIVFICTWTIYFGRPALGSFSGPYLFNGSSCFGPIAWIRSTQERANINIKEGLKVFIGSSCFGPIALIGSSCLGPMASIKDIPERANKDNKTGVKALGSFSGSYLFNGSSCFGPMAFTTANPERAIKITIMISYDSV
jgi:hypothetical protein